ncbi:Rho termination factor N-terminal domain-containing protein [Bacillus thuringiensis]|uniref:Rho termination factor-like N-terminal domain-containing protein n=1 Tax=Bacillus thuringiensis TaxID=1428 RepID=A0A9X6PZZ0_BACTU|nr:MULTISPECIES: Rho termination factor N-terminal domain-containing protein [Bacillus cereus group]MDA2615709.1 Rho termination factor N-terminal domain-containing protein [Bacillus cereus]MEB8555499.1 Rho termination factor N-terminal domain-containing protein [Bacillus cereus]MEB8726030.1 Rho termination factor N-terminal domain-containing protein [Bacillus cereus]MEB8971843.1 Rho termination factor N-terminal domain-containing protein [Bacillus cereus]MEB9135752.1 Rho termination factor N-
MITEIRKTISGTEYWDNKEKRSLFVPTGEEPGFEVTVNPESMIADKGFATGGYLTKDKLAIGESGTELILSNKTIKELREYADELGIEIPSDIKKKEDIIDLLS